MIRKVLLFIVCLLSSISPAYSFYTLSLDKEFLLIDKNETILIMTLVNANNQPKEIRFTVDEVLPSGNKIKLIPKSTAINILPNLIQLEKYGKSVVTIVWNNSQPISQERIFHINAIESTSKKLDQPPINISHNYKKRIHISKESYKSNVSFIVEKKIETIKPQLLITIYNKGKKSEYINNGIVEIKTKKHVFQIDISKELNEFPLIFPHTKKTFLKPWPEHINELEKIKKATFIDIDQLVKPR